MNTRALNSLADLICRAQEQGKRTPMGIAMAIDAAGRHMSPEWAAERAAVTAQAVAAAKHAVAASERAVAELKREHEENARLRDHIAELLAERHVTNEALSEAAEALRVQRDRIAELEALKPAAVQTCRKCGAGYTYGEPCSSCLFKARMAAEGVAP